MPSDAQFTTIQLVKPYLGFEAAYQAQPASRALLCTPDGGPPLDKQAGTPGFDPRLVSALSVPLGARLVLWLPVLRYDDGGTVASYVYSFFWRLRSMAEYKMGRNKAFHISTQKTGIADPVLSPSERYVIPAAMQGVVYNQTEPAGVAYDPVVQHIRQEQYAIQALKTNARAACRVELPNHDPGAFQQGVSDVAPPVHVLPEWIVFDCQALGDEMIITMRRDSPVGSDWDFTPGGVDENLSNLLGEGSQSGGLPYQGVYVMSGMAP